MKANVNVEEALEAAKEKRKLEGEQSSVDLSEKESDSGILKEERKTRFS